MTRYLTTLCMILSGFLLYTGRCVAEVRTWTSTSGTTLEAEYVGYENRKVTLRKPDNTTIQVDVRQLSEADRNYLREEFRKNPPVRIRDIPLFPIRAEGKYGYIDTTGRVVIPPRYSRAEPFSDGLGLVKGQYPGFITADGVVVIGVDEAGPGDAYKPFSEGLAPFRKDGKWGLLNRKGKVIMEPRFADIGPFSHGRAVVRVGAQDSWGIGKRGFIDTTGNVVIEPVYNEALEFSDGLAAVNLQGVYGQWGYIDPQGRMVIEPQFHRAFSFYDGLARAMPKDGGGFGLIDKRGKYVVSKAGKKSRREKVDGFTVQIAREAWHVPGDFGCGVAPVYMEGELFLLDQKGKKVTKALPYRSVAQFVEDLAVFEQDGKYGYLNTRGVAVIPATFKRAEPFHRGLAKVQTDTGSAYINPRGSIVWSEDR